MIGTYRISTAKRPIFLQRLSYHILAFYGKSWINLNHGKYMRTSILLLLNLQILNHTERDFVSVRKGIPSEKMISTSVI